MSNEDLKPRFFEAALEILATEGYGGLKLSAVCQRLKVTTGAFYHAFASWTEFTTELLTRWRRERTTLVAELSRTTDDPAGQLSALLSAVLDLPHQAEAAIRVWATVDADVATVQRLVDNDRYGIALEAMTRLVGEEDGPRWARWGRNVVVGYQMSEDSQLADLEFELRMIMDQAAAVSEQRREVADRMA